MGELRSMLPARVVDRSEGKEQRTALRFDTYGRLSAQLVVSQRPMAIRNVGLGGFSADVDIPVSGGGHVVQLITPDRKTTLLEARNVYCLPLRAEPGRGRYSAGFEFVRPPETDRAIKGVLQQITQLRLGRMWV